MAGFFISCTQADRDWAAWIAWKLEAAGYSTVIQDWDFRGNFILEMDKAIKESDHTIAVLSPDYLKSVFGSEEWAAALRREQQAGGDRLIPIRVGSCEPDGLLGSYAYLDLVDLAEAAARERVLARVSGQRMKPGRRPR